jgi:antitoxin VapB
MALRIEGEETERLAREIAQRTGETPVQAIVIALRERLTRLDQQHQEKERRVDDLMAIIERSAHLPILDSRHPDEIIGYDEHGLPR